MATCKYLVDVELSIYLNDEEFKLLDERIKNTGISFYDVIRNEFWYSYARLRKHKNQQPLLASCSECDNVILRSLIYAGTNEANNLFNRIKTILEGAIELKTKLNSEL